MKSISSVILFMLLALVCPFDVYPAAGPFDEIISSALEYFTPVSGTVQSVEEGVVLSALDSSSALREGMRLSVLRSGEAFLHPVTGEPLGRVEEEVGMIEAVEVGPEGSKFRLLWGNAREGDAIRLSARAVRALFYQTADTDWDVSEEYYLKIQDTGRFEIIDIAPGSAPLDEQLDEVLAEGRRNKAEVAIVLSSEHRAGRLYLKQRYIWVNDPKELTSSEVEIAEDVLSGLKRGEDVFFQKEGVLTTSFKIPFSSGLLADGDVDGDGRMELALSNGRDIMFYSVGRSLYPALDGVEIEGKALEEHLWLQLHDIDADGRAEVIVSAIKNFEVTSYVHKYVDGMFKTTIQRKGFLRASRSGLLGQEYSRFRGFKGDVYAVTSEGERAASAPDWLEGLPGGVNIYSFDMIESPLGTLSVLAYEGVGRLVVYGPGGNVLWRSREVYSKPVRTVMNESSSPVVPQGELAINDRIDVRGGRALAIRRTPRGSASVTGLGYKESGIMRLRWDGSEMAESELIGAIDGNVVDFAYDGERIYVLVDTYDLSVKSVLSGGKLFATRLAVYNVGGR